MSNDYVPPGFTETSELFSPELATPLLPGHYRANSTLDIPAVGSVSIAAGGALEGTANSEQLGAGRAIGDINEDHFIDFVFESATNNYILFGPVSLANTTNVAQRADLTFGVTTWGVWLMELAMSTATV